MRGYWSGFILACVLVSNTASAATFTEPHWRAAKQHGSFGRTPRFRPMGSPEKRISQVKRFRPKATSGMFQRKQSFVPATFRVDGEIVDTDRPRSYATAVDRQFRPDRRYVRSANNQLEFNATDTINRQFRPISRRSGRHYYPNRPLQPTSRERAEILEYSKPTIAPWDTYGKTWSYP